MRTIFSRQNSLAIGASAKPKPLLALLLSATMAPCLLGQSARPSAASIPDLQDKGTPPMMPSTVTPGIGGLTDEPIAAGEIVHIVVYNAPDFSLTTRVSESGDIAIPVLGILHLEGLDSRSASELVAAQLKDRSLMVDPLVTVTVDASTTGVTVLGEVRSPGIFSLPGKRTLSDVIAAAGGLIVSSGRVIEISNRKSPGSPEDLSWDPTMHNTANYDRIVNPGDRILVRGCGFAYVGGHVSKPGAYSLCGSAQVTLSELIALAGGVTPLTSEKHVYLVRTQPDQTKVVQEVDLHKILRSEVADIVLKEDDIIYVTPSTVKDVLNRAVAFALSVTTVLFYNTHP